MLLNNNKDKHLSSENVNENGNKNKAKHLTREEAKGAAANPPVKCRVVPSRYKAAAIEAAKKGLANTSDSFKKNSPLDKTKLWVKAGNSSRSPKFMSSKDGSRSRNKSPRLHSTAVDNSTFFEQTNSTLPVYFSTTIVGGPNRNKGQLPEISLISPTSAEEFAAAAAAMAPSTGERDSDDEFRHFTPEDMKREHVEYLTWSHIDINSKEIFDKQVSEAKKQISFLAQLVEKEENAVLEEKKKSELLDAHTNTMNNYELMKNELLNLNETVHPCVNSLQDISHHLEFRMNQIKLENIYQPLDEAAYKDLLNFALKENVEVLQDINSKLHGKRGAFQSTASLFTDVADESEQIEACLLQSEKLASLAVQEASIKLSKRSKKADKSSN